MGPALKTENAQPLITRDTPNHEFTNSGLLMPSSLPTAVDMSDHSGQTGILSNMLLAQSTNGSMAQGVNDGMIKTEASYPGMPEFIYGVDGNVMEMHPAPISSFGNVESNSEPGNEPLIHADNSPYGLMGQISQNFGPSDFTTDFSHNSGLSSHSSSFRTASLSVSVSGMCNPLLPMSLKGPILDC